MVNIFLLFVRLFSSFISNTSTVSINFRANLDAQNAGNDISGLQISNIFWGTMPPDPPPIHTWYVGHMAFGHCCPPLNNILYHKRVPFQKRTPHPPTRHSLKKARI